MAPPETRKPHAPKAVPVPEAGELLGISRASAYRAARVGDIPTIRLGRRLLVPLSWIDDVLEHSVTKWEAS